MALKYGCWFNLVLVLHQFFLALLEKSITKKITVLAEKNCVQIFIQNSVLHENGV